jgi:hypothetical protein
MESMDYSRNQEVNVGDERYWYVGLASTHEAEVVVPVSGIGEMSNEEIGAMVRLLSRQAEFIVANMIAEDVEDHNVEALARHWEEDHMRAIHSDLKRFAGLSEHIDNALGLLKRAVARKKEMRPGFVYVIRCGPYFKIGRTVAITPRLKALSIQLPHRLEVVLTAEVYDMVEEERWLHKVFEDRRLNGEWFDLDDGALDFIRRQYNRKQA